MAAGALGVTTSRNHGHRTVAGELAPSVDADRAELLALAQGLADAGTGVFQMIPNAHYGDDPQADIAALLQASQPASQILRHARAYPRGRRYVGRVPAQHRAQGSRGLHPVQARSAP